MLRLFILLLIFLATVLRQTFATSARPNIVVILADDLGWNDVSFHGSPEIPTPNIDKLALNGIILNNYYVQPICTPTRAALLTGRHPIHTGMQHSVIVGSQPYGLPLHEKLLPQYLKDVGYRTHMVGKWHLGFFKKEYLPTSRGFDSHFGYWLGCEDYFMHIGDCGPQQVGYDFHDGLFPAVNYTNVYSTEVFTQKAVDIIRNHDITEPLFLYIPHQAVHSATLWNPLQAPQHYIERFPHIKDYRRRIFAGMVSALDDSVGVVHQALLDRNMMSNTIIIFSTDNGGPANGFNNNAASNFPLRGVKFTYWEGGVRGVGFINSPLLKNTHYISNNMMQVMDWFPTILSAAGVNTSEINNLDGIDMWKMLSDKSHQVRNEMLHNIDPYLKDNAAIRVGDYKLIVGQQSEPGWDGWYPPWRSQLHLNLKTGNINRSMPLQSNSATTSFVHWIREISQRFINEADVKNVIEMDGTLHPRWPYNKTEPSPYTVKCGPKPINASINCQPEKEPCLFHVKSDPCEYNNIASSNHRLVLHILTRLESYAKSMVPPGNKPIDSSGDPKYHNGYWVPWKSH